MNRERWDDPDSCTICGAPDHLAAACPTCTHCNFPTAVCECPTCEYCGEILYECDDTGDVMHDDSGVDCRFGKPDALDINACAKRISEDCNRLSVGDATACRGQIGAALSQCHHGEIEQAFTCALFAMRHNPRAFALAGLIGQHAEESEVR